MAQEKTNFLQEDYDRMMANYKKAIQARSKIGVLTIVLGIIGSLFFIFSPLLAALLFAVFGVDLTDWLVILRFAFTVVVICIYGFGTTVRAFWEFIKSGWRLGRFFIVAFWTGLIAATIVWASLAMPIIITPIISWYTKKYCREVEMMTNNASEYDGAMDKRNNAGTGSDDQSARMWYCPNCGTGNTGNFCSGCGTKKP